MNLEQATVEALMKNRLKPITEASGKVISEWGHIVELLDIDEEHDCLGGLCYTDVDINTMKEIMKKAPSFIEDGGHNDSPRFNEFIQFCEENNQFIMEIYAVSPIDRGDYRIDIVGVKAPNNEENAKILDNWINKVTDDSNSRYVIEPQEYGEYDGMIRAWWD